MTAFSTATTKIESLARTSAGNRDNALASVAFTVGLLSTAMDDQETELCLQGLVDACQDNGLTKEAGATKIKTTIQTQFRLGFEHAHPLQAQAGRSAPFRPTFQFRPEWRQIIGPEVDQKSEADRVASAQGLWAAGQSIKADSPADLYLTSRALVIRNKGGDKIRQGEWFDGTPCLMVRVSDMAGQFQGIQAIRLTTDGQKISNGTDAKRSHGLIKGNAFVIHRADGLPTYICEGPEDALSIAQILPDVNVWCSCGKSNLANLAPYTIDYAGRYFLMLDRDASVAAFEGNTTAKRVWQHWPQATDINDLMMQRIENEANIQKWLAEPAPKPEPSSTLWWNDIMTSSDSPNFVENYLTDGGLSVVYGDANTGKSFFAIDLGAHVALGWTWMGKQVKQGAVIYCALEGQAGAIKRLEAFAQHHGQNVTSSPLALYREPVNLLDDASTAELIEAIQEAAKTRQEVRLVIIDTLSRAMVGGNENSPDDMSRAVSNADRVRLATGAHVMLIHHTGKDQARGARGHSSLRAATDTELEISHNSDSDPVLVEMKKQRDLEYAEAVGFRLHVVELGRETEWGTPVTSCVVMPDQPPEFKQKAQKLNDKHSKALELITDLIAEQGRKVIPMPGMAEMDVVSVEDARNHLVLRGVTGERPSTVERQAWKRAREALVSSGKIIIHGERLWLP